MLFLLTAKKAIAIESKKMDCFNLKFRYSCDGSRSFLQPSTSSACTTLYCVLKNVGDRNTTESIILTISIFIVYEQHCTVSGTAFLRIDRSQ